MCFIWFIFGILVHNVFSSEHSEFDVMQINKNFKSVPTTIKTFENDTILLPCNHRAPYKYARWYKEGVLMVDSRHPEILPPERFHLWTNGSISVTAVQTSDTGEYYCEIMTTEGLASQIHAIEVQYAPTVLISPNGVIELPIGSIFEIVCEARGMPQPVIMWKQNKIEIKSESLENRRRLLIEVNSRNMSGPIHCIADNGVKESAKACVHLIVLFKPIVNALQKMVHTKINMKAQLECNVEAAPSANVHWFHHGVPVQKDFHITKTDLEIKSNSSLEHYYTISKHILTFKKVKDHDLGMYECRAENRVGFMGVLIELTGRPMPSIFKISPILSTPTTHNLIWQTESLSPIIEYKLKFRQTPSGNVTPQNRKLTTHWNELTIPGDISDGSIHTVGYTLHGLYPASVYEVFVISRNVYGWSDNSNIIRFATGGEIELPNNSTELDDIMAVSPEETTYTDYPLPTIPDYAPSKIAEMRNIGVLYKYPSIILLFVSIFILVVIE